MATSIGLKQKCMRALRLRSIFHNGCAGHGNEDKADEEPGALGMRSVDCQLDPCTAYCFSDKRRFHTGFKNVRIRWPRTSFKEKLRTQMPLAQKLDYATRTCSIDRKRFSNEQVGRKKANIEIHSALDEKMSPNSVARRENPISPATAIRNGHADKGKANFKRFVWPPLPQMALHCPWSRGSKHNYIFVANWFRFCGKRSMWKGGQSSISAGSEKQLCMSGQIISGVAAVDVSVHEISFRTPLLGCKLGWGKSKCQKQSFGDNCLTVFWGTFMCETFYGSVNLMEMLLEFMGVLKWKK